MDRDFRGKGHCSMAPHHQGHAHPLHPCVLVGRTGCLSVDQVQLTNLTSSSDRKRENHCQLNRKGTHPLGSEARSGHQGTGATAKHAGKKKAATLQKPICAPPEEDRWRCGTSRLSLHVVPIRFSRTTSSHSLQTLHRFPHWTASVRVRGQVRTADQRLAGGQEHPQEAGNFLPTVPHEAKFQQQKSGPLTPRSRNPRRS